MTEKRTMRVVNPSVRHGSIECRVLEVIALRSPRGSTIAETAELIGLNWWPTYAAVMRLKKKGLVYVVSGYTPKRRWYGAMMDGVDALNAAK